MWRVNRSHVRSQQIVRQWIISKNLGMSTNVQEKFFQLT
jgi:hypothetical protein